MKKSRETAYEIWQEYFQLFTKTRLEQKQGNYHIVVGYMNTRLHARLTKETTTLGPHVFRRNEEFLKNVPQLDKENRQNQNHQGRLAGRIPTIHTN